MPFACIGADVITGFPGETDDDFDDTLSFIRSLNINYLHIFPYSERPNTKAALMGNKIQPIVKTERSRFLRELSDTKRREFYEINAGRTEKVIFESRKINELMHGFTSNYIKVEAPYKKEYVGSVREVLLENTTVSGNFRINV